MRTALLLLCAAAALPAAPKFYSDDPIWKEPAPAHVPDARKRKISDYYDFFLHLFGNPGQIRHRKPVPAQGVNTWGEVPDSAWYTNRNYWHPMTVAEIVRGPGDAQPPAESGRWLVIEAKTEGVTPGFRIRDARGTEYLLKFDPLTNPEMATAADVISSKLFYALGYSVPENYIVTFPAERIEVGDKTVLKDALGRERRMTANDVVDILLNVPRMKDGKYRGVASRLLPGKPLGPYRYFGTRQDDPNDVVPHEHRRDLRGLSLACAWLGHDDSRAINSLDLLVEKDGRKFVQHNLIDFGSTLGSASNGPNSPRSGFEYLWNARNAAVQFASFGLVVPQWERARFPRLPAVGRFESEKFDAAGWVPEYPNPAFVNRLPDDAFWAAKQIMEIGDEAIRAVVKAGRYSDPRAEEWVVGRLIERRNKIGRAFLTAVLPLDRFEARDGLLTFTDVAAKHKVAPARTYAIAWSRFDNATGERTPIAGAQGPRIPEGGDVCAEIRGDEPKKTVLVYLRAGKVVGIERSW